MNTAESLTIPEHALGNTKAVAEFVHQGAMPESVVHLNIARFTHGQHAELFALYMLGSAGVRSYNVGLASAKGKRPEHIVGTLAVNANVLQCVNAGMKSVIPVNLQNNKQTKTT